MYTPAAWTADIGQHNALIVSGDDVIAVIDDTLTDWQRNAKLIAAAPALLATLAELVAEWDALHADEDHKTGYTPDTGGIVAARALLESTP